MEQHLILVNFLWGSRERAVRFAKGDFAGRVTPFRTRASGDRRGSTPERGGALTLRGYSIGGVEQQGRLGNGYFTLVLGGFAVGRDSSEAEDRRRGFERSDWISTFAMPCCEVCGVDAQSKQRSGSSQIHRLRGLRLLAVALGRRIGSIAFRRRGCSVRPEQRGSFKRRALRIL